MILDISDPGYRYWKPENVQSSAARVANANRVAFIDILALLVTPLKAEDNDRMYAWLLEGTEREVRKIHDATGLSPKLLHTFAQITHLAARMIEVCLNGFKTSWIFLMKCSDPRLNNLTVRCRED